MPTAPSVQGPERRPFGGASDRAPPVLRWVGAGLLALLLGGAGWLIMVRGEAILVDLAALGSRAWCF